MHSGLLWHDANADKNLMQTIDNAAKRYREKFGVSPDTCYVNRAQLKEFALSHRDALPSVNAPNVLPSDTVIKNHVWLGISNPTPRVAAVVKIISGAETDGSDAQDNRHEGL